MIKWNKLSQRFIDEWRRRLKAAYVHWRT